MNTNCCQCDGRTCAVALARWSLGIALFFIGLGKFPNVGQFAREYILPAFKDTWLPQWLVLPYAYALPFLEVGLGALLILGLFRNPVLFLTGLLFLSLTFGQILMKKFDVVSNNMIYIFMTAAVLCLDRYDRWVLGPKPAVEPTSPPA
jgi:thiosulfate dehydrogenase [quinone] large subunit